MNVFSTASTSSSTASDEDLEGRHRKKRKFWKDYFRRLTRQVLYKQEEMQMKFLEAIEKREREWVAQQDCWRMQEMARINKEHEILIQERSTAAAKDVAVIAMLQKLCGNENPTQPEGGNSLPQQPPQPTVSQRMNINGGSATSPIVSSSSSRWPKAEVHALIRLRTSLEPNFHENGPKAPLWEELSAGMQRLGYNRNAKRCKEKWENINKYFKKMRESNKQDVRIVRLVLIIMSLKLYTKKKAKSRTPLALHCIL
ncbi:Myb-like domain [Sesbania bispinosa]|nr:Myb-like domain [Sesbania bispinosa]